MYVIDCVFLNKKEPNDIERINKMIPLLKSVFGYTDIEINKFAKVYFRPPLAIDVTLEQARLVKQSFNDNGLKNELIIMEYDDITHKRINFVFDSKLGIVKQSSQENDYNEPIIKKEQLVDPLNPPSFTEINSEEMLKELIKPTIKCPYCQSTNTKKISGLSKAGSVALFGIFALGKTTKQWHCNECGSDF